MKTMTQEKSNVQRVVFEFPFLRRGREKMALRNSGRKTRMGMTLIELMVALLILSLIGMGLLYGVMLGVRLNYASAQHAAAFGLCMDVFEQMRGAEFNNLTSSNYPPETLRMTHLGGTQRVPLNCLRTCQITPYSNPTRKEISIEVAWTYQGRSLKEDLDGVIFAK